VTHSVREPVGSLAIVLHSHMPYVEGFGTYPFGEEWLFDAVIRSYVPVSEVADRLTMTVTPVLADQLEAEGVAERLLEFARRFRVEALADDLEDVEPAYRAACEAELERNRAALAALERLDGRLCDLFAGPAGEGRIELLGSAATHAVLPLVATTAGRRLQVDAGLRSHARRFGLSPGFWLPECAYEPGLERLLAEHGVEYFCVDQSAAEPELDALDPAAAGSGTVAMTIDWPAISWLWSMDGYPSDPSHTDFHRKSMRGARLWSIGGAPYDPETAVARAREQGREFAAALAERLARFAQERGRRGLVVFSIDTELIGHWWAEGPAWLAEVIAVAPAAGIELLRLGEARDRHPAVERRLRGSTWGEAKDLRTWDSPPVADLAWGARRLELRLLATLGTGLDRARAVRAARELLAVQASDWAFLDRRRQAGDYPFQRAADHARELLEAIDSAAEPPAERLRNLAPDLRLSALLEP
jgi:1,4-alpha-glucan branching enzyme